MLVHEGDFVCDGVVGGADGAAAGGGGGEVFGGENDKALGRGGGEGADVGDGCAGAEDWGG